jgi:hypothetical protein
LGPGWSGGGVTAKWRKKSGGFGKKPDSFYGLIPGMVASLACGRREFCGPEFRDPRARAKKAKQAMITSRMIFPEGPSFFQNLCNQFGLRNEESPTNKAFLIIHILANKFYQPGLCFSEHLEAAGESSQVHGLLEFKTKGRGWGLNFERVDPDHSTAGAEGQGGGFKKFLEEAPEIRDGDTLAERGIGDEECNAARAVAGNAGKLPEIFLDKIGADS